MAGAKKGTWIAGTVAAALAIVLASWFLAINPALSAAAEVRTQAADTRSQNEVLATKVAKLKADFAKLDQYKADLAALQVQIPTTAQLSDYLRQLDKIAAARSVTITAVTPGVPQAVILATTKAKAASAAAAASSSEGNPTPAPSPSAGSAASSKTAGASASAASGVPDGLAAIPLSITVLGTYDNTLGFLSDIQNATPRLFLVSGFTGTKQDAQEATGGKPATKLGDQELVVNGFMYVLREAAASAPTPSPSPSSSATPVPTPSLPAPVPGKNPLIPVGGK